MTTPDRLLTRRELHELLRVSSETIRRWMRDGKLPPPDVSVTPRTRQWWASTLRRAGVRV